MKHLMHLLHDVECKRLFVLSKKNAVTIKQLQQNQMEPVKAKIWKRLKHILLKHLNIDYRPHLKLFYSH